MFQCKFLNISFIQMSFHDYRKERIVLFDIVVTQKIRTAHILHIRGCNSFSILGHCDSFENNKSSLQQYKIFESLKSFPELILVKQNCLDIYTNIVLVNLSFLCR